MKPAAFDYARPGTLASALAMMADGTADPIAGGQSLLAMMNLRVANPSLLVDIRTLPELREVEESSDAVTFGACVTHAAIEDGAVADPSRGMMSRVAGDIAYRAVRTRGTLGGSLALADPAADWLTVMPALGAVIELVSATGTRLVGIEEFVTGIYQTTRRPDEVLRRVHVPRLSQSALWGLQKFNRKVGEFASSIAACVCDPISGHSRIVLGGLPRAPLSLARAAGLLADGAPLPAIMESARAELDECGDVTDDYLLGLHLAMIERALREMRA